MVAAEINKNEIMTFFKTELLESTIEFHEKLDKFDNMLWRIFLCPNTESLPIKQQLFDITFNSLLENHYKLTFNYDLSLLELKNAENILMNFKCLVLKAFCRNSYSYKFLRKNRQKLRLIFVDILDYLKNNYPISFYEGFFNKREISFIDNYELTELFLRLNKLIYETNLYAILDGNELNDNFNTLQLWNQYCFKGSFLWWFENEHDIDKDEFLQNATISFRS